jgi:hypothetical protein
VPIACTLTPDDASDRMEEWRRFLSGSVGTAIRTSREQLRIRLKSSTEGLLMAVDLAQRERACCEFFQFSIRLGADARWLVIGVPTDAIRLLDDFEALLPDVS